jgi:hypothetical protein
MFKFFKGFQHFNRTSVPVVIFLDYFVSSFSSCVVAMLWSDEHGSVREGPDPSTGLRSGHSAVFLCAKTRNSDAYQFGNADLVLIAGFVVRCRAGFAYSHSTRAKADVPIRTLGSRSASHRFNCVLYRLKNSKSPKSTGQKARIC